jgi:hypothetical protein
VNPLSKTFYGEISLVLQTCEVKMSPNVEFAKIEQNNLAERGTYKFQCAGFNVKAFSSARWIQITNIEQRKSDSSNTSTRSRKQGEKILTVSGKAKFGTNKDELEAKCTYNYDHGNFLNYLFLYMSEHLENNKSWLSQNDPCVFTINQGKFPKNQEYNEDKLLKSKVHG